MKNKAILSLGTNLGDRHDNLRLAKELIKQRGICVCRETEILETKPIGFESKNLFLNQLVEVSYEFSPINLLKSLESIEKKMGRNKKKQKKDIYVSRIIDLDILFIGKLFYHSIDLTIPHPQVYTRKYVIELLKKI